jgi:hypothetical protein
MMMYDDRGDDDVLLLQFNVNYFLQQHWIFQIPIITGYLIFPLCFSRFDETISHPLAFSC